MLIYMLVVQIRVEGRYFPPFLDARKSSEKALIAD
jgi:hypothetical protein